MSTDNIKECCYNEETEEYYKMYIIGFNIKMCSNCGAKFK